MIKPKTGGLLLELLNHQVDAGDGGSLSEARIRYALTVVPGFSEVESRLIWRAPLARDNLLRVKVDRSREVLAHWRASGIEPVAEFKAAADDADKVIKVQGNGFALMIFPQPDEMMPWILSLQIDPELRVGLPAGLRFQLVDSGGMV